MQRRWAKEENGESRKRTCIRHKGRHRFFESLFVNRARLLKEEKKFNVISVSQFGLLCDGVEFGVRSKRADDGVHERRQRQHAGDDDDDDRRGRERRRRQRRRRWCATQRCLDYGIATNRCEW